MASSNSMATGSSGGSFSTTTIVNSSPATTSTPERRAELLRHARKSRLQWILNGLDDTHRSATLKSHSTTLADLYRKIPAAECLQQIINFLTTVIDDGEVINIEALVPPEGLDEDFDEKLPLPTYETCLGMDPYLIFIEKLKHPLSIDIVKLLQQFITKIEIMMRLENQNMSSTYPPMKNQPQDIDEKISQDIWAFLKQIHGNMRDNLLWKSETTEQWNNSMISCEKFLFIKLYDCLFGNDMKLLEQDERIRERIESLSFLSPDHLDMKSLQYEWTRRRTVSEENLEKQIGGVSRIQHATDELTIGKVVKKLRSISQERCPSDKLRCLKEVSQMVIQILTTSRKQAGRTSLPGADDFLPALILIIKEANPAHLHSTAAYIQRYTHPTKLVSEAGYILTHFVSAIHFLETVDATALTISPLEFEMRMAESQTKKKEKESEWRKRADELKDLESREMILKEDGQLISVSEYEKQEKANRLNQQIQANESLELRQIYSSLRDRRQQQRNQLPISPSPTSGSVNFVSSPSVTHHKNLLLQQVASHSPNKSAILQSLQDSKLVNYYGKSLETLSLQDIHRLHSEYRLLAQACASFLEQIDG